MVVAPGVVAGTVVSVSPPPPSPPTTGDGLVVVSVSPPPETAGRRVLLDGTGVVLEELRGSAVGCPATPPPTMGAGAGAGEGLLLRLPALLLPLLGRAVVVVVATPAFPLPRRTVVGEGAAVDMAGWFGVSWPRASCFQSSTFFVLLLPLWKSKLRTSLPSRMLSSLLQQIVVADCTIEDLCLAVNQPAIKSSHLQWKTQVPEQEQ